MRALNIVPLRVAPVSNGEEERHDIQFFFCRAAELIRQYELIFYCIKSVLDL